MSEERVSDKAPDCDLASLERFLSDTLGEDESLSLEKHLNECADCRGRLECLAAEPALWAEAHDFLSASDEVLGSRPSSVSSAGGSAWRAEADVPSADHVLGFLSATDDPRMLGRLGGYEIAGVIGSGGMGVVLKGLDVALNRYVAIKVLAPHLATSAAARSRFAREARAAAAVVHENVIAIHAVSEASGLPYLVMPYIRGASLQKRLDAEGPLATAEVLRIGMQTARGLAAAHAQGLVHRDIKPANILLEDGIERLKITDFGLARAADDASLTRSGVIAGTPQFMSPEQARGDSIDKRSDLFSLGSVLYALCTGRPPFRAETSYGVLRRITDDDPRPVRDLNPDIPEWLASAIVKLLAKSPDQRWQSADEIAELFEQCLAHVQQPDAVGLPEALAVRPASGVSVRRLLLWTVAAVSIATVATAASILALRERPKPDSNQESRSSASASSIETSRTDAALHSNRANWHDGAAEQITELQNDMNDLEAAVETGASDKLPDD